MITTELEPVAKKACPQWRTEAVPKFGPNTVAALTTVGSIPCIGSKLIGLAGATELGLRVISEKVTFSNDRARNQLKVKFRPLEETVRDGLTSIVDGGWVRPTPAEGAREAS